jgi:hypothetical protein
VPNTECDGTSEGSSKVAECNDESDADGALVVAVPDCDEVNNTWKYTISTSSMLSSNSLERTRKEACFEDSDQEPQGDDRGTVLHTCKPNG